jgi:hypothetical protein
MKLFFAKIRNLHNAQRVKHNARSSGQNEQCNQFVTHSVGCSLFKQSFGGCLKKEFGSKNKNFLKRTDLP